MNIAYNDLIIGDKVRSRSELVEHLGISVKKLRNMGGYENILSKYGLERPSIYHYENKKKVDDLTEYVYNFVDNNGRLPMIKEAVKDLGISREFVFRGMGGYKIFLKSLNIEHKKQITQSQSFAYSKEELIEIFKSVYKEPPNVRQLIKDVKNKKICFGINTINTVFISYDEFVFMCGMQPNSTTGQKRYAKDGHLCDSIEESIIDDFLFNNNIEHEVHKKYYEFIQGFNKRYMCDFYLKDGTVVEYFGFINHKIYVDKIRKKVETLKEYNIPYIDIYPKDLSKLDIVFGKYLGGVYYV